MGRTGTTHAHTRAVTVPTTAPGRPGAGHRAAGADLTDPDVRDRLSVSEEELVGDDYARCQQLAEMARDAGLDGLIAHSAALDGHQTLAVFAHVLDNPNKIVGEHSRVQVPPVTLLDLLPRVRPVGERAGVVRALFDRLVSQGRDAVRRARR